MDDNVNGSNNQEPKTPKAPGRRQMTALWIAVATALGSQGVPKIIEMLGDKPGMEQVQTMIGKQTQALTSAQHQMADAVRELDEHLRKLEQACGEHRAVTGQLEGRTELLKDVLRDCCTRTRFRSRLEHSTQSSDKKSSAKVRDRVMRVQVEPETSKKNMVEVKKVPDFNMQKQLQAQESK